MEVGSSQQVVQLTEADVPGALLEEPIHKHSIPALKWWLLCCGMQAHSQGGFVGLEELPSQKRSTIL